MATKADHIIEFYGETCPHCLSLKPVVAKIEEDKDIDIQKLEVWNHPENQKVMQEYEEIISDACGGMAGVPAFVNTNTKQALCGEHDERDIIALIDGADCTGNVCKPHTKMADKK